MFIFYFNARSPRCVGRSTQNFAWWSKGVQNRLKM